MVLSVLQRKQGIYNYRFMTSAKNKVGRDLYDIITPRCHRKAQAFRGEFAGSVKNSCDIRDHYDFFGIDHFPNRHNIGNYREKKFSLSSDAATNLFLRTTII
jgi:hypothetical protein